MATLRHVAAAPLQMRSLSGAPAQAAPFAALISVIGVIATIIGSLFHVGQVQLRLYVNVRSIRSLVLMRIITSKLNKATIC
jgi:hypothetical protein